MIQPTSRSGSPLVADLVAGSVVFLVALPLCLGVALASKAPLMAGLIAGIVGGIVVGLLSRSHTSVSGPAAGLTAVVAAQIASLGSFEAFLFAVVLAGVFQVVLGLLRAGFMAAFVPSSVIKGLLAAIGVILILKQIPHVVGHDKDPEGDMAFFQFDEKNTFTEFLDLLDDFHPGACIIGLASVAFLVFWDRCKPLKKSIVPAPLVVVLLGVAGAFGFEEMGALWSIKDEHLVQVPTADSLSGLIGMLAAPNFGLWLNPAVYAAAVTIAIVASLETLLNLEAVDKLDPMQRTSPPSRELFAQGVGNIVSGLLGGLPITSVIVRSSVNINAGGRSKLSTLVHGTLLLVCVVLLPGMLNLIPLSCLAAILLVTGIKLVNPALVKQMWSEGKYQFIPFAATVVSIVLTDLLIGILIGLAVSIAFILRSNLRRPLRRIVERHLGGEVLRIELASQVSFLNRAVLEKTLRQVPHGGHVLLDARNTDYIDPDILDLIRDFREDIAPAHGVQVSMLGFRTSYAFEDRIQYVDYSTRDIQSQITPPQVLQLLKDGNERFLEGKPLTRNSGRAVHATASGQHPLAVILSCIDSRTPAELVFDLGLGDIFSIRIAGNVVSRKGLASIEYGCFSGAKLVVVMGHTRCGAVTAAVEFLNSGESAAAVTGCAHLEHVLSGIQDGIDPQTRRRLADASPEQRTALVDDVARNNVLISIRSILASSDSLAAMAEDGRIMIVGAMYDVATGRIVFLEDAPQAEQRNREVVRV